MNILYIHGFAARFDESSTKVDALFALGPVFGMDIDYTNSIESIVKDLRDLVLKHNIDLVVGSSLGGFYANLIGNIANLPFVAINPAIEPFWTLKQYIGDNVDWHNKPYHLKEETVEEYPDFINEGNGLILLDLGDTILNPIRTLNRLLPYFNFKTYEDGSHRFEHIEEALPSIKEFYEIVNS